MSTYATEEERDAYDPGPCPTCASTDVRVEWVDVGEWGVEPGGATQTRPRRLMPRVRSVTRSSLPSEEAG